ncbi:MAG TPA: hypothetical protein DEB31_03485 [Clostridiales bacterium]|nr:hypothetical protein [Clostridiales bacterium]
MAYVKMKVIRSERHLKRAADYAMTDEKTVDTDDMDRLLRYAADGKKVRCDRASPMPFPQSLVLMLPNTRSRIWAKRNRTIFSKSKTLCGKRCHGIPMSSKKPLGG